jgi:hypothetical protein
VDTQVDPTAIIKRLKGEIRELKEELRLLKGDDSARELTDGELQRLRKQCEQYVADPNDEAVISWESMLHVRAAMSTFRRLCRGAGRAGKALEAEAASGEGKAGGGESGAVVDAATADQIKRYRLQVRWRADGPPCLPCWCRSQRRILSKSWERVTSPKGLGISETAHGPTLEYRQLLHGSSTHSHQRGSRHAMVPLSDASPHPEGGKASAGR